MLAAVLEEFVHQRLRGILRTVYFIPAVVSITVAGILFSFIYNPEIGLLNRALTALGLESWTHAWLGEPGTAIWSIIAMSQWQSIGYATVLFVVALQRIPREMYEAARIDGAGPIRTFFAVTVPMVREMTTLLIILTISGAFLVFNEVQVMTAGGPSDSSQVLGTWLYRNAFLADDMGYASAIAAVIFVITFGFAAVRSGPQPTQENRVVTMVSTSIATRHAAAPATSARATTAVIRGALDAPNPHLGRADRVGHRGALPPAVDDLQQLQGQPRGLRQPVGPTERAALEQLRRRGPGRRRPLLRQQRDRHGRIHRHHDAHQRLGGIRAGAPEGSLRRRRPGTPLLGGLMVAPTVALIPLFGLLQQLGIFDTYWALIVLYTAFRIPFTTFLIRAYLIDMPRDVDEAAAIDGASRTQIFWHIIMPMCRPILVSAALLQALFAWNEFAFALVFISNADLKTLPVGLMDMQSRLLTDWPVQFAGLTMAALPMIILFLIGQRQFLRGLTEGMGK